MKKTTGIIAVVLLLMVMSSCSGSFTDPGMDDEIPGSVIGGGNGSGGGSGGGGGGGTPSGGAKSIVAKWYFNQEAANNGGSDWVFETKSNGKFILSDAYSDTYGQGELTYTASGTTSGVFKIFATTMGYTLEWDSASYSIDGTRLTFSGGSGILYTMGLGPYYKWSR